MSLLQRALRGHALRCKVAKEEHNQSAEVIQSALKGFNVKSQHIEKLVIILLNILQNNFIFCEYILFLSTSISEIMK